MLSARIASAAFAAALLAGCASLDITAPGDLAAGDAPIQTSATEYTLQFDNIGHSVDIPIRFHNVTGRTLHIVNCQQILVPVLEKRVGDEWRPWWHAITPLCLSSPIVIRPGATLERTLRIWGAPPNSNYAPAFTSTDLEGTYRIVLGSVVYAGAGEADGVVPEQYRVSNTFMLRH